MFAKSCCYLRLSLVLALASSTATSRAADYPSPVALKEGAQASFTNVNKPSGKVRVAYMPPATEFNYYIAIGEGIKTVANKQGVETFMLAPQSGADINGQMGMIQDVLTQNVNAIIVSTHDEFAAAPLLKQAVDKGIVVIIVNSDIPEFPTPIHGVVGYSQRKGTAKLAKWFLDKYGSQTWKVAIIEGQPGYHSTERCGGFKDGIANATNVQVVASLDGKWNVEGGNAAAMDLLQGHPDINAIFAANDYMAIGAALAAKSLGNAKLVILGNDGDTTGLEDIYKGDITATVNTSPFTMGQVALLVVLDALDSQFKGGFVETPTTIVDKSNVVAVLQHPESLYPKPSQKY
jgi:ribose transport system substrate-binding protein